MRNVPTFLDETGGIVVADQVLLGQLRSSHLGGLNAGQAQRNDR